MESPSSRGRKETDLSSGETISVTEPGEIQVAKTQPAGLHEQVPQCPASLSDVATSKDSQRLAEVVCDEWQEELQEDSLRKSSSPGKPGGLPARETACEPPCEAEEALPERYKEGFVKARSRDELISFLKENSKLKEPDPRPHLNVIFIGHVDAGKSTLCGNILVLTGEVDRRTLEKFEREAKEKNRETWVYAFILDINEEERQRGKTVETGRAFFQLSNMRFTIIDAPGHKGYVPNMIDGAAQADVAVLIISARKGEFETGFEKGGQTREHVLLARTIGVNRLIVAVNKMDDLTCDWNQERYNEVKQKLNPFLKNCGFNLSKDVTYVPVSALSGQNLCLHATDPSFGQNASKASWYDKSQPSLFDIFNNLPVPERNENDPLRIPLLEGYRDQGAVLTGKIESGMVYTGQSAIIMPSKLNVKILSVLINDEEVLYANSGENVSIRISGATEDQISKGFVLCSLESKCAVASSIKVQMLVLELLEHRPLLSVGYSCIIHAHTVCTECQITQLIDSTSKVTKRKKLKPQFVTANTMVTCVIQVTQPICVETFDRMQQLGRFTLRDEGKTLAVGKIIEIVD